MQQVNEPSQLTTKNWQLFVGVNQRYVHGQLLWTRSQAVS